MKLLIQSRTWVTLLALVAWAIPCFAGELAVLRNGFSIRHERREVIGANTRLYTTLDGSSYVDIPTADIEHYEAAPEEAKPAIAMRPSASQTFDNYAKQPSDISAVNHPAPLDLNQVVNASSERYRLDPDLVNSVIKAESGFNVRAVSRKGAQGLMQLMPGTASQLGVPNAFDPQANVDAGAKYLRELLERYNFDLVKALAAYNAGPQRVEQYGGVPPYYETRAYVARIVRDFNKKKTTAGRASVAKNAPVKNHTPPKTTPAQHVVSKSAGHTTVSTTHGAAVHPRSAGVQAKVSAAPSE